MSDIPSYGKQRNDGIRAAGVREPNFPPNYTAGEGAVDFSNDLISDPAGPAANLTTGWESPGTKVSEV